MIGTQLTLDAYRNSDPETSREAAARASVNAGSMRTAVYDMLRIAGPSTDFEIAAALIEAGYPCAGQTSAGKRRGELRDAGLVAPLTDDDGRPVRRPSPSGSPSIVWRAL